MNDAFPLLPFRSTLYSPDELFAGFDPAVVGSYATTPDFAAYRSTWLTAGHHDRDVGMLRALHDQCISDARDALIAERGVVAIMGGHGMHREDPAYRAVAHLAAELSRRGYLVATGGGPGAMEASHLGALLSPRGPDALDRALARVAAVGPFPASAAGLVGPDGVVDEAALADLHAWQRPAFELLVELGDGPRGESLAIPTWFYGHEPPTPFATHLAKYFANAVREDGLLAIAVDGVIFSPGRAGTLQEIFQEACQNYYRTFDRRFSPMAFLDVDGCWSERFPVARLLRPLFGDDYDRHVRISPDPAELLAFLADHDPAPHPRVRPAAPL